VEEHSGTSYLEALTRQRYLVALFAIVGFAGPYWLSKQADPVYSATTELLLNTDVSAGDPFENPTQNAGDRGRELNNAVAQLRSAPLHDEVGAALDGAPLPDGVTLASLAGGDDVQASSATLSDIPELEPGQTPSDLLGSLDVRSSDDSDALRVSVESTSPAVASDAANLYVAAFQRRRTEEERAQLTITQDTLSTQLDALQPQIADLDSQIAKEGDARTPNLALIDTLTSRAQLLRTQAADFERQLQSIDFQLNNLTGGVEVLRAASEPSSPVRPTPLRDGLLGSLAGLVAGAGLGFVRSERDRTLRSSSTAEEIAGMPILGMVPRLRQMPFARPRLVSMQQTNTPFSESFAAVRSALQFLQLDEQMRTIVITSSVSGEGKTTIVANLAVAFARSGARVTVVGADLRRPSVHDYFGVPNEPGLSNVAIGSADLADACVIVDVPGGAPIRVLPSGPEPPNPAELLATGQVAGILTQLASDGDLVLIDAAPITPVTDAVVLSRRADAVLVVCAEHETQEDDLATTVARLERAQAKVVGLVYNRASRSRDQSYYREDRWYHRLPGLNASRRPRRVPAGKP
jgi:capsular exopolysaccharide synthesis family protein